MAENENGVSWLGACVVAGQLLRKSKEGKEGTESFASKMARSNFSNRAYVVMRGLNTFGGATLDAVKYIQQGYFTDVPPETLYIWLKFEVNSLKSNSSINFPLEAFGNFDFFASKTFAEYVDDEEYNEEDDGNEDEDEDKETKAGNVF